MGGGERGGRGCMCVLRFVYVCRCAGVCAFV